MGPETGITESDPLSLVVIVYLIMAVVMAGLWVLQKRVRNASIGDVGWCMGLMAAVIWYTTQADTGIERTILTAMLVVFYAGRLGRYILFDRVIGKPEDARYQRLRKEWGDSESAKMFTYFQLQALAVAAFSVPFLVLLWNPRPQFSLIEIVGLLIWGIAVAGETRADRQLAHFRADPRNHDRVCQDGLWRYSRHPNYFFEWLHWCSYVVMTMGAPGWLLTWIGPILMGALLLKVTGIPRTEAQALVSRGEEYRNYQRTTSAFIPWFRKSQ